MKKPIQDLKIDIKVKRERQANLRTKISTLDTKLLRLEAKQRHGDFSAETARQINILRSKIEVTDNRMNGNFEKSGEKLGQIISIPPPSPLKGGYR